MFVGDCGVVLGAARVHDLMSVLDKSLPLYKRVLAINACNVEALACCASYHFYNDQPEVALKYYRHVHTPL